ncbi:hypothetical protein LCGC14_2681250 [marine sediment metagenome]|uniref:Uncharacterized protein n=1 Tax=marine sediment metagenome TaxID=412755 RepID=A0A0F8ZL94_9ZZZZ
MTRQIERWRVEDVQPGDYISVQISNPHGDRNLDGVILRGKVKDLVPSHRMIRLENGWCCHTKDRLLEHRKVQEEEC